MPEILIHIPEGLSDRLDKALAALAPEDAALSRSRLARLIADGAVTGPAGPVADGKARALPGAYSVQIGPPETLETLPEAIPLSIAYEDADLIVVDKPAGMVVHPAPGAPSGTLVNALLAHCADSLSGIGGAARPGIVHRIDKDTSGLMVVAKTEQALAALSAIFAARDLDRAYVALVWGLPSPAAGEIEGAIGRDPRDRKRMAVVARGGKAALTRYRTLRAWGVAAALLKCQLATGRTHQIRVHLAATGHPVVGDPTYLRRTPGAARTAPDAARRALLDFPRQALHATRLGFRHARTGAELLFERPPPGDFQALVAALDAAPIS